MHRNTRDLLMAGACATSLMTAGAAFAAAPAPAGTDTVQEVVVTAQKREEKLLNVPLAVQSISAAEIAKTGAVSVSDLVSSIPGASVVSGATPGFETIQIRGIASGTTGDGLIGYYIDDTPFGIPNLQLTPPAGLLDIERAEVIRGPSGTLYGQGSMGGTIKLVTAKPNASRVEGKVEGDVSGTDGGDTNYAVNGVLNLPLIPERLALRVAGGYSYLSGYADAPELHKSGVNDLDSTNVRASLRWTPTNNLTVTGFVWSIRDTQGFNNSLTPHNALSASPIYFPTPYGFPAIAGTGGKSFHTRVDADVESLTFEYHSPIGDFTSNTSNIQHLLSYKQPLLTVLENDSAFKTHAFTQEVRLASLPDSPVRWIAGASYRDATITSDINYFTDYAYFGFPGVHVPIINIRGPLETKSWSVFGEVSKTLFDGKLEPLVGLRYFEDERGADGIDRSTGLKSSQSATYHSLNPRFNLKWKPTDNGMVYFNAAKGFRSGALQTPSQAAAANAALGLPAGTISTAIQPDSLWTYELGTRWQLAEKSLVVDAGVYHTDWNKVLVQFATTAVISLANAGDARIDGVDGEVTWRTPVTGLNLSLSGNYNKSKFTKVLGALSLGTAIKKGGELPNVPKSNVTVAVDYKHGLDWFGGSTASLYAGYSFRDKQNDATVVGLKSDAISNLNLRAQIRKDRVTVEAYVTNATGEDGAAAVTSTSLQIPYPRRIGVKAGYSF